mmetsp:Transcript_108164/g.220881  ORF Transcript_108164/g.220881 Transcript_108164/m.220881 type:complete len:142 (+) Transcript_108164:190-615(+)
MCCLLSLFWFALLCTLPRPIINIYALLRVTLAKKERRRVLGVFARRLYAQFYKRSFVGRELVTGKYTLNGRCARIPVLLKIDQIFELVRNNRNAHTEDWNPSVTTQRAFDRYLFLKLSVLSFVRECEREAFFLPSFSPPSQ